MRSPHVYSKAASTASKNLRSTVQKDFYNKIGTSEINGDEVRRSACGRQSGDRVEGVEWPTLDPLRTSAVGLVKRLSGHPVWSG
jgi:hypothetical protein